MAISIEQLRQKIEAKHQRQLAALAALEELHEYLDDEDVVGKNGQSPQVPNGEMKPQVEPTGSNREKVLAVIGDGFYDCPTIARATGLTIKQVYGVVTAPNLANSIQKKTVDGVKVYHWEQHKRLSDDTDDAEVMQ